MAVFAEWERRASRLQRLARIHAERARFFRAEWVADGHPRDLELANEYAALARRDAGYAMNNLFVLISINQMSRRPQ